MLNTWNHISNKNRAKLFNFDNQFQNSKSTGLIAEDIVLEIHDCFAALFIYFRKTGFFFPHSTRETFIFTIFSKLWKRLRLPLIFFHYKRGHLFSHHKNKHPHYNCNLKTWKCQKKKKSIKLIQDPCSI